MDPDMDPKCRQSINETVALLNFTKNPHHINLIEKNIINKLKKDLGIHFEMKYLGPTQQIMGMKIICDIKERKLWLSQEKCIEKVLDKSNMKDTKPIGTPLAS
jgi:hypothetical protein